MKRVLSGNIIIMAASLQMGVCQERPIPEFLDEQQLLNLASVALSEKEGPASFVVTVDFQSDTAISFRAVIGRRTKKEYIIMLLDRTDKTPVWASFGGQTICYASSEGALLSADGSGTVCTIKPVDGNFEFDLRGSKKASVIDIDLGALLHEATQNREIAKDRKTGRYRFNGSYDDTRVFAVIDPDSEIPLQQVNVILDASNRISFSQAVWENPPEMPFEFPADELGRINAPTRRMEAKDAIAFGFSLGVRQAIRNPELRPAVQQASRGRQIDWEELARKDSEISVALRKVFARQLTELGIQQDGADQPDTAPESKPVGGDKPQPESERRSR